MGSMELAGSRKKVQGAKQDAADARNGAVFADGEKMAARIIQDETDTIVRYLGARLSGDAVKALDAKNGLKVKIGGVIEENFREMLALYQAGNAGGRRGNVLSGDAGSWAAASRNDLAAIAGKIEKTGKFNTGDIEKENAPRWGLRDAETKGGGALRQGERQSEGGAFCSGENAGSVVQCVFRDNPLKPKTVTDIRLSFAIPDAGLISPAFQYRAAVEYFVREIIGGRLIENIDRETSNMAEGEESEVSAKEFLEKITDVQPDFAAAGSPLPGGKTAAMEELRGRGFAAAVDSLVAALEGNRLDYQFIEKQMNRREACIREYEDAETETLPDERFQIKMQYMDREQLAEERKAYDAQVKSFITEVQHLWDLVEVIYQDSKSVFKVNDFDDLAKKNKSRIKYLIKDRTGEPLYENIAKVWDEITFVRPAETDLQKASPDYGFEKNWIRDRFARIRERIQNTVDFMNAAEQRITEERLASLEREFFRFEHIINPFRFEAGLIVDLEITTIKRKMTTFNAVADTLNQFALRAPADFHEAGALVLGAPTLPAKASPRKS